MTHSHNPGGKCHQLHATRLVRCEVGNCPARLHHKTALPETSETKTVGGASRGGCDSNGRVEMFKVLPSLALGSIDISEKTMKSTDPVFSMLIPRDVDRVESRPRVDRRETKTNQGNFNTLLVPLHCRAVRTFPMVPSIVVAPSS